MDNPEGTILSVESGPSNILYRIEKANHQIVHVKVLNPEVIPEDKRTYGPSAISELSKLKEWNDDSWKTLQVHQDQKGIWCEKDISPPPTVPKEYLLDYPIHDISELTVIHHTKSRTSEVAYNNGQTAFLKIARFPHELQYVTQEIRAYNALAGSSLAPALVAYVSESLSSDRIIGFLVEKVIGHHAGPGDLKLCEQALDQLHSSLIHGDLCKYNIIITEEGAKFIDLEDSILVGTAGWSSEKRDKEEQGLACSLADMSGRGRPWVE